MTAQDVNFKINKVKVGPFLVTFAYTGNILSLFSHPEVGYNFGGCCPAGATPWIWAGEFVKNLVCAYGSLKSDDQDRFAQILEADPEFKEAADLYKSWNAMVREADQEIVVCERALEAAKLTKKIIQQSCEPVATTNQEEREVLYTDATGTYKLVRTVGNKTVSCDECAFASSESPKVGGDLLCGMFERKHFVKVSD